jgi:hypothetical protein
MKTLYTLIDPYPYSQLTVHEDYKVLAKRIGYEHKFYTIDQQAREQIDHDSSPETIFMFEPALLKHPHKTTKDIKRWFPNCKIVALSSEALTYKHGYQWWYPENLTHEFEIYDGYEVDLWLDINDEIVEDYAKKGLKTDSWEMTTSHFLIEQYENRPRVPKTQDIISLMGHRNAYRNSLIAFLTARYKCQFGMHPDQADFNLDNMYQQFSSSRIVLGTSSPCWWSQRSMKGFRDWMGPICGTVLIYDDYPDVIKKYTTCPIYKYDNFNTIAELFDRLVSDPELYSRTLAEQLEWAKNNTIAIQLYNALTKHNII